MQTINERKLLHCLDRGQPLTSCTAYTNKGICRKERHTLGQKFLVSALLCHNTSIDDSHLLRCLDGGQPMRNYQHCPASFHSLQSFLHQGLALCVQSACCLQQ